MSKKAEEFMDEMFSEMSPDELKTYIQKIRLSRNTPKATTKRGKQAKKQSVKKVDKTKDLFNQLSDKEREELMAELLGGEDE